MCTPPTTTTPPTPSYTTHIFTSNMEALDDMSHYPAYCRRGGPDSRSNPILRARKIFDHGTKMPPGKECTNCIRLGQDCVRYDGKFSKCCWCTAEDFHPVGLCHLPGVEEPRGLSMTANAKKRRLDNLVDSDKRTPSPTPGQLQFFANTPRKAAKFSQDSRPHRSESLIDTQPVGNKERLTELENQISNLNHKFIDLVGKIDELVSSVKPGRVVGKVATDDSTVADSTVASDAMVVDEPVKDECCPCSTVGLPIPDKKTKDHAVADPVEFAPVNCKSL